MELVSGMPKRFEQTKRAFTSHPVLVMPNYKKPAEVISDAFVTGLGAVLVQGGRPVAYESRQLTCAESNFLTAEKELLGALHAMRLWRCHLRWSSPWPLFTIPQSIAYTAKPV